MIDFSKYQFDENSVKYDGAHLSKRDLSSHIRNAYNVYCELIGVYLPSVLPSDIYYNIIVYKHLAASIKFYVDFILDYRK